MCAIADAMQPEEGSHPADVLLRYCSCWKSTRPPQAVNLLDPAQGQGPCQTPPPLLDAACAPWHRCSEPHLPAMSSQQQQSREALLAQWKARKAATGGQPLAPNSQRQPAAPAKPAPGLPPRLRSTFDKENARAAGGHGPGAMGGPAAAARAPPTAPDSVQRKAFASGQQQQDMLQEFDSLQGRLQALKRESVRPSISGAGGAPLHHHSTASTTLRPVPEAAAARATQPAPVPRPLEPAEPAPEAAHAAAVHAPAPASGRPPQPRQQQPERQQPERQQPERKQPEPEPALPPAVASTRGSAMDIDCPPPASAAPASHALPLTSGVGGLAARLESLKRESVRPSLVGGPAAAQGVQFESAAPIDSQALSRLAIQLFDDEQFRQLCDKGMNMQLTRSKDGATGAGRGWWLQSEVLVGCVLPLLCSACSMPCCLGCSSSQPDDALLALPSHLLALFATTLHCCLPAHLPPLERTHPTLQTSCASRSWRSWSSCCAASSKSSSPKPPTSSQPPHGTRRRWGSRWRARVWRQRATSGRCKWSWLTAARRRRLLPHASSMSWPTGRWADGGWCGHECGMLVDRLSRVLPALPHLSSLPPTAHRASWTCTRARPTACAGRWSGWRGSGSGCGRMPASELWRWGPSARLGTATAACRLEASKQLLEAESRRYARRYTHHSPALTLLQAGDRQAVA